MAYIFPFNATAPKYDLARFIGANSAHVFAVAAESAGTGLAAIKYGAKRKTRRSATA
jgi:hypothetical protein